MALAGADVVHPAPVSPTYEPSPVYGPPSEEQALSPDRAASPVPSVVATTASVGLQTGDNDCPQMIPARVVPMETPPFIWMNTALVYEGRQRPLYVYCNGAWSLGHMIASDTSPFWFVVLFASPSSFTVTCFLLLTNNVFSHLPVLMLLLINSPSRIRLRYIVVAVLSWLYGLMIWFVVMCRNEFRHAYLNLNFCLMVRLGSYKEFVWLQGSKQRTESNGINCWRIIFFDKEYSAGLLVIVQFPHSQRWVSAVGGKCILEMQPNSI